MASASVTLLIFGIWSVAHFGPAGTPASANKAIDEANVFGSFRRGLGSSVEALKSSVSDLKQGLEVVNFEAGTQMEANTLNTYGQ